MIRILDGAGVRPEQILTRGVTADPQAEQAAREIIAAVRARGIAAVLEYTARFDRAEIASPEVTAAEVDAALDSVDASFLATLEAARDNITEFHRHQLRSGFVFTRENGMVLGQRISALARVGVYIPGGTASYPSTVLMNAIPAKLAGVPEVVMVTPPQPDGSVKEEILAAARLAGVDRIFRVGGAQAVAALAYGAAPIPRVDKIVGPGNVFVAAAKRLVYGQVDIDMIAGPSEILVISDGSIAADVAAADLLSQAEHDKNASAVLITTDRAHAQAVAEAIEARLQTLPRREIARASVEENGKILVVSSLAQAAALCNAIAPEHLELCVADPFGLLGQIKNAGSVFLGCNTPEALGDYMAGPNHTLPTSGTARFSSPLSVDDFIKKSSFIYCTPQALAEMGDRVAQFAEREGLSGHARSVLSRTRITKGDRE